MFGAGASRPAVSSQSHPGSQGPGGSQASSPRAPAALNSQLRGWPVTGGPSRRGLGAPPGRTPPGSPLGRQSVRATEAGPARGSGRDRLVANPAPAGRRRTAARRRGANFYTDFLFRFGVWRGSGTAPDGVGGGGDPDTDFPPPGAVAALAPRSPPAFRRTQFSPLEAESGPQGERHVHRLNNDDGPN